MLTLLIFLACGSTPAPPDPAPPAPPPPAPAEADPVARADAAIGALGTTLQRRLKASMAADGPAGAVKVCSAEAQELTASIREESGISLGRSSLKLRNPRNAPPDWVRAWLQEHEGKPAREAQPSNELEAGTLRAIRPIGVGAPCLACHGTKEQIPAAVRAHLHDAYPDDQATGYALGDLRGAFWAEVPI